MGIQGLTKLLSDYAPQCIKEQKFNNYFGRKIAIDASMSIYQFLIVVGRVGDQLLTSETGEVTSHLQGMFYRTARMLEAGMRPVYVFDGAAPQLKREQLDKRSTRREEAQETLQEAMETGVQEDVEKYSKRTVRVAQVHNDDCRHLLRLMGVPVIDAPSEAEAQCAAMAKQGVVYAAASEDMDSLTFGTPRLIRHLMAPQAQQAAQIMEFEHGVMLEQLALTSNQFVDMCILCGCDYCGRIKGLGPVRAMQLIQKHGSIEEVLANLDPTKYPIPESFPFKEARQLFKEPDVVSVDDASLKWSLPDEEALVQFLVHEKNFNEERVRGAIKKVNAGSRSKASQGRIEQFFAVKAKPSITRNVEKGVTKKTRAAPASHKRTGVQAGAGKIGLPSKRVKQAEPSK